jgi:hypothetical protein
VTITLPLEAVVGILLAVMAVWMVVSERRRDVLQRRYAVEVKQAIRLANGGRGNDYENGSKHE